MDFVTCEALLDTSFQRDKLELVNKGSLSQRRKPTRSNLRFLLSPANNGQDNYQSSPRIVKTNIIPNGHCGKLEEKITKTSTKHLESVPSSSPPVSPEPPNYVLEAQQFSIEAKLKNKSAELGRSAVLIQTWERRTLNDIVQKSKPDTKSIPKYSIRYREGQFCVDNNSNMPDTFVSSKYTKGCLSNGGGGGRINGLVPNVRGFSPEVSMLYNIREKNSSSKNLNKDTQKEEPEWISLSRKLRAKFIEGHLSENHSTSSLPKEEPEGMVQSSPTARTKSPEQVRPKLVPKKEKVPHQEISQESNGAEPPWIHLSRKLCTKFIEEHIEYPKVVDIVSKEVKDIKDPVIREPNGDVRIIEKIGKPIVSAKSKSEPQPEWISLSKKLRAKFIESHIDDPEAISFDNQLNVSDFEESNAPSLSNATQENSSSFQDEITSKNKNELQFQNPEDSENNRPKMDNSFNPESTISEFNEKECCWQYQELYFDEESNSETFPSTEMHEQQVLLEIPAKNETLSQKPVQDHQTSPGKTDIEIAEEKAFEAECGVKSSTPQMSKDHENPGFERNWALCNGTKCSPITVQFITNPKNPQNNVTKINPSNNDSECEFSKWEAECYASDKNINETPLENGESTASLLKTRSKSMDDILERPKTQELVDFPKKKVGDMPKNRDFSGEGNLASYLNEDIQSETKIKENKCLNDKTEIKNLDNSKRNNGYHYINGSENNNEQHYFDDSPHKYNKFSNNILTNGNMPILTNGTNSNGNLNKNESEPVPTKRKSLSKSEDNIFRNEYANLSSNITKEDSHCYQDNSGQENSNHESIHSEASHDSNSEKTNGISNNLSNNMNFDIPLCAKLVLNSNTPSTSSNSHRIESPLSENSHVYEDIFKESTSCPSDSETSSWTIMKSNTYYINGRSSSMNDLDHSDGSVSMKCEYTSSCSDQSTLQSGRSSCASSSFYVNLRDYDHHMMEPGLMKKKKDTKVLSSGPPTPESLKHLFTSPLQTNRTLMTRAPSEPQNLNYFNSSSAFKHVFEPIPKPKKTERSSSIKIKDIAHGIILTFKRFQNHKSSHISPTQYVDVSHLAEGGAKKTNKDNSKSKNKSSNHKQNSKKADLGNNYKLYDYENGKTDTDSGYPTTSFETHHNKARRSASDVSPSKFHSGPIQPQTSSYFEKKKYKYGKKSSDARDKGKKNRNKIAECRSSVPTVSRKVQQMADGTLCLVTTVSGDTAVPGFYSDSPDTSSELSYHKTVKLQGESNC